jgi:nucleotide-binding universal stress UspA family protein
VSELQEKFILAGVDGSAASACAARWAATEADLRNEVLRLLFAYQIPIAGHPEDEYPQQLVDAVRAAGQATLDRIADAAADLHPDLRIRRTLKEADPRLALDDESTNATLTVVGCKGKTRLAEVLLGSVALHVAAHGHSPAVVVPESDRTAEGPIVVGADGTSSSDAALGFAFDEAALRGTELVALVGWDELSDQRDARRPVVTGAAGEDGEALLTRQLEGWSRKYPEVSIRKVVHRGPAAQGLLGYGQQSGHQPQLIVVGSRGRGGLSGLILGSTSHTVIIHAQCPVVVVRPGAAS